MVLLESFCRLPLIIPSSLLLAPIEKPPALLPGEIQGHLFAINDEQTETPIYHEVPYHIECAPKGSRLPFSEKLFMPSANAHCNLVGRERGSIIFNTHFSTDSRARRVTPPERQGTAHRHFLIMGDSFVWGHGVQDAETLPAWMQRHLGPHTRVYNLGFLGYSPNDVLARIQKAGFMEGVSPSQGTAIYLFIPEQFDRARGTLQTVGHEGSFSSVYSFGNESLTYQGPYKEVAPLRTRFYETLAQSRLLQLLHFNWPPVTEKDYDRFVGLIQEIKKEYLKRFGADNAFYFVFYPQNIHGFDRFRLRQKLSDAHIDFLDYSGIALEKLDYHPLRIPYDGHPTARAHKILAEALIKDLAR